jgi:chitin disaccharide deacetylase
MTMPPGPVEELPGVNGTPVHQSRTASGSGVLLVNADDWGRDQKTTDRTLDCILRGAVSSVSAMVFMDDSLRASSIAREHGINTGLHLNLTTPFSVAGVSAQLTGHQQRLAAYLRRHRVAHILFHPGLVSSFEYVVAAQLEEFERLYGAGPNRIDGHHHAHLCANVLLGKLLPAGTIARRSFSFCAGEKSFGNRFYRRLVDRILAKRHHVTDLFFSLPPLEPERLQRIFSAAREFVVELETHPANPEEYRFLAGGEIFRWVQKPEIGSFDTMLLPALARSQRPTSSRSSQ